MHAATSRFGASRPVGCLGDEPDDRLGAGRPHVHPAIRPGQPEPVPVVRRPPRGSAAQRLVHRPQSLPRGPLALTIVYRGAAATSAETVWPDSGKQMQDQRHPQGRVAPHMQGRETSPRRCPPPRSPRPRSRLPGPRWPRRPGPARSRAPAGAGRILDNEAGRQVGHDDGACLPPVAGAHPAPPGRRRPGCSPHRSARRARPPGPAGPRPGPPPVRCPRPLSRTSRPSSPRFSGIGSGARGNRPSVSRLIPVTRQPQPLEQRRDGRAAGAPDAVQRHVEAPRAGWPRRRSIGSASTASRCRAIASGSSRTFPMPSQPCARRAPLGQRRARAAPALAVEEDPVRPDELQGVPLDRVVAGGEDQAGAGVVVFDRELDRRRRHDARRR